MSEGGLLAWKIQRLKRPANGVQATCNFSDINQPLPDPPKGQTWIKDGREWKLVPVVEAIRTPADGEMATAIEQLDETGDAMQAVAVTAVPIMNCSNVTKDDDEIINGMMYHRVKETDTFQGLCLKYKVTPIEIRRANKMMGRDLKLAPEKLLIPINKVNANLNIKDSGLTREERITKLVCEVRGRCKTGENSQQCLAYSEARAYLEMNDWDLNRAVENAVEDMFWSSQHI